MRGVTRSSGRVVRVRSLLCCRCAVQNRPSCSTAGGAGLLILKPALFSDYAEALAMLDFHDDGLDALKNAIIDRLVHAPDLDAAALRYHLNSEGYEQALSKLFGSDMTARLGGLVSTTDAEKTDDARVRAILNEIIARLARTSGKSNRNGHR